MEPNKVLTALRAAWWLPLVGLVVGGLVAFGGTLLQTPVYTASTQFFVAATGSTQATPLAQERAASYARLLGTQEVAALVVDDLGLDESPASLRSRITATAPADTVVVEVSVTDSTAEGAQRIARALEDGFPDYAADLETRTTGLDTPPVEVTTTERAALPGSPTSPDPVRNVVLGLLAGLAVGVAVVAARALLPRRVRGTEQVVDVAGATVGEVPRDAVLAGEHLAAPGSAAEDAFRQIRKNLQWLRIDNPPRVLALAGTRRGQGVTTTAVNLARALAADGRRVVLVDADLCAPSAPGYLGVEAVDGLTTVLAGDAELTDVLVPAGDGLAVLPAGPVPPNAEELLAAAQTHALLDKLRGEYDFVLVDGAAVLDQAGGPGLAAAADGVLLVARYGRVRTDVLQQAADRLAAAGATVLGAVLTAVPEKARTSASA